MNMQTSQITRKKDKLIYPELSYKICGLCFKVHNDVGRYKSEKSYTDALEKIFTENNIKFDREIALSPSFEGENNRRNIPDFIIEDKIILDVKAKRMVTKEDYYQMRRYLEASSKKLGLIVNFRGYHLHPKRILNPLV